MSKENELLATFTKFMLEHDIECEEDLYQNEAIDRDSFELIEDLFNIVDSNNVGKDDNHTNADMIRNMSDEELAEFLITFKNTFGEEYEGETSCMEWLQSEAE
jgi:hypothetical protein